MQKLPQRLVNRRVRERGALETATEVNEAVSAAGRRWRPRAVFGAPSGTEPLVRVMVEAPTGETDEVWTVGSTGAARAGLITYIFDGCAASLATSASPVVSCCRRAEELELPRYDSAGSR